MAAKEKDKVKKPVIKVEEVEDDAAEVVAKEGDDAKAKSPLTSFSSFSQLDSSPPPSPDTKTSPSAQEAVVEVKSAEVTEDAEESDDADVESPPKDTPDSNLPDKEQISSDEVKEWLKDVRPDTSKENEKGKGPGGKLVVLIVLLLFVVGAIVGGVLYFQKGVNIQTGEEAKPTETPKETPTPSAAVEEEVDLTAISVNVLNGSGIAGEAGKVKDLLSKAGFAEDKIETGNAESYDYETVSVSAKEDVSDKVIDVIEKSLSDGYEIEVSEDKLDNDSEYDVEIIIGK